MTSDYGNSCPKCDYEFDVRTLPDMDGDVAHVKCPHCSANLEIMALVETEWHIEEVASDDDDVDPDDATDIYEECEE